MTTKQQQAEQLKTSWKQDSRWNGIERPYTAEEVVKLRGSTLGDLSRRDLHGSRGLRSIHETDFVNALGALTGDRAVLQ